jgi:thioredoxin-dependent peroxiredoxin
LAKTPEIGQEAPGFTLPGVLITGDDAEQSEYTLSAHRGHPIVLAF